MIDDREFFCGAVNVSKGSLEGAFVDDLAQLADAGLHAVSEGSHPSRLGAAAWGSERANDGAGTFQLLGAVREC